MKLYLNAEGNRERIVPMWCDAQWQRRLWCFFHGHAKPHDLEYRTVCGICLKTLNEGPPMPELNPDEKHWRWNGEPVTWHEFCDRLEAIE